VSLSKPSPSLLVHDLFPNVTYSRIFNMCNATPFKHNSVAGTGFWQRHTGYTLLLCDTDILVTVNIVITSTVKHSKWWRQRYHWQPLVVWIPCQQQACCQGNNHDYKHNLWMEFPSEIQPILCFCVCIPNQTRPFCRQIPKYKFKNRNCC
jgi:hypothetical protein